MFMEPWIKLNHRQFWGGLCPQSSWWSCWVAAELFIETSLDFCKNFQVLAKICLSFRAVVLAMSKNQLWGVNETSPCSQILLHRTEADIVLCLQRQLCAWKGMKGPIVIAKLRFFCSPICLWHNWLVEEHIHSPCFTSVYESPAQLKV